MCPIGVPLIRAANSAVVIQGLCLDPDDYSLLLLTGGLTVIIAGALVKPWGIDLAGGVETDLGKRFGESD